MQSNTGIHCKVQYRNEFRRFHTTAQFDSFLDQIKRLFNFPEAANFLLKYKDEEGDMVTISSNEELLFAIELFSGSVLRLVVIDQNKKECGRRCPDGIPMGHRGPGCHKKWHKFQGAHHDSENRECWRGKWHKKLQECSDMPEENRACWRERWHKKLLENPELLDKKIFMLTNKREHIKSRLEWFQNKSTNHPNDTHPRKNHLEMKLKRIEGCLERLQELKNKAPSVPESQTGSGIEQPIAPIATPIPDKDALWEALKQGKEKREVLVSELSELHLQIQTKKNEIQAAKLQSSAESKKDVQERVKALKEGIWNIRQGQQQKKAELQAHDANIRNIRCQFQALKKQQ